MLKSPQKSQPKDVMKNDLKLFKLMSRGRPQEWKPSYVEWAEEQDEEVLVEGHSAR